MDPLLQPSERERGLQSAAPVEKGDGINSALRFPRRFEFERDSLAFSNELMWEYRVDPVTGQTTFGEREQKPNYAHRCFVVTRATRQFFYHARFDESQPVASQEIYRRLILEVLSRNPRTRCAAREQVVFPGFAGLRPFSKAEERLLKSECGGAWRSYVLRSHWRMIFPISREHQTRTATRLSEAIRQNELPVVHIVQYIRFPQAGINHGLVLFDVNETKDGTCFSAYDPNDAEKPTQLDFDRRTEIFTFPANRYWAGGRLNVIEIYRGWLM